jgi:2-amino-4-hydroxy-6-hydroxymethyldihydropteridine diphosphokinase
VIEIETDLSPEDLLKALNSIESDLGRKRGESNGPRTMDLDILYYGDKRVSGPNVVIPHPRISEREFVLKGLRELGIA